MKQILRNTFISTELFLNEYEYYFGKHKDDLVNFEFYNEKFNHTTNRDGIWTYKEALSVATRKTKDQRCKNLIYLISL